MGKQSKEAREKEFWEKWKVNILNIFKTSDARKKQIEEHEKKEIESYINFIYEFTEIHGVRETARKLDISHATLSQIRNGHIEGYNYDTIRKFAESISNLGMGENEKKS